MTLSLDAADPPNAAPAASVPVVTTPTVIWPPVDDATSIAMACPNCGSAAPKPLYLSVSFITPDHPRRLTSVFRCPDCTCRFYDDQNPPDYTEPALLERGRVPFYLQQGAGVSLITSPLARIRKPAGSAYLEVGCGFGFGLDFAIHMRGWHGSGIDPAPLSGLGRELLGLDIALRYFEAGDAERFRCDVILSSETIEHVPSPIDFIRILAGALKPDGILILTTPDADSLTPETPAGSLVPLLSPGLHLVFQNEHSLRTLLGQAGFGHVVMERDGYSLVAFAARVPFELENDRATLRQSYRTYLEIRAETVSEDGDLFLGFIGRALFESVNDGAMEQARRAWDRLRPVCIRRFGFDPDDGMPPDATAPMPLEALARRLPLNLAAILYARAMLRLAEGSGRPVLEGQFIAGALAADTLRRALHDIAIDDMMAEQLGWICRTEACLCAAEAGQEDGLGPLRAIPLPPGHEDHAAQIRRIALRAFVGLVNGSRYEAARRLAVREGLTDGLLAAPETQERFDDAERDAVFCSGVLDVQPGGDPARALRAFRTVRRRMGRASGTGSPAPLFWEALRGEVIAATACWGADYAAGLRETVIGDAVFSLAGGPADLVERS